MISAVVLSHNDEKTLPDALKSIAWCDEIIVVDDFSSDESRFVAKRAGAKIFKRHLEDDFAKQRNFALTKAKGNWVLFVDADEVVTAGLRRQIQESISQGDCVGYYLKRRDHLFGKDLLYGETSHVELLRLAQRHAGKWTRPVHEVWEVEGKTAVLTEPLLHFPHPDVSQFLADINVYSTRNAKYYFDNKVKTNVFEIICYPVGKFLQNYVWRLGFLDGTAGAVIAIMMSFHSFLTRAKLYLLWRDK